MNREMVLGLLRHLLTMAGGYLVSQGWLDDAATVEVAAGAIITLAGLAWSAMDKRTRA